MSICLRVGVREPDLTSDDEVVECLNRSAPSMKAIEIQYPESWTAVNGTSAEAFAQDTRMAAAVKLFEMGRLTSGQVAQSRNSGK